MFQNVDVYLIKISNLLVFIYVYSVTNSIFYKYQCRLDVVSPILAWVTAGFDEKLRTFGWEY